jgi:aminoglycoside phosphotransferase (APT) family kinase protein
MADAAGRPPVGSLELAALLFLPVAPPGRYPGAMTATDYDAARKHLFYAKTDLPVADGVLRSLRNRPNEDLGISIDGVERGFTKTVGPVANVAPLGAQGTFHRLFRADSSVGPMVLRASVPLDGTDWGLWLDGRLHGLSQGLGGLPGPRIHGIEAASDDVPFDFEVMDEVPGTCLRDLDGDDPAMESALEAVGRALAGVHRVRGDGFGPIAAGETELRGLHRSWREYFLLRLPQHVDVAESLLEHPSRLIERAHTLSLPEESALLHCDLGSHNLFVEDGAVSAILDWEDAVLGDPVFDLALWATFQPRRRHAAMLRGYYGDRPRPPDLEPRFWLYFARVTLAKVVHRLRFGYPDVPGRPTLRQRMDEAMAELERACASS